MAYDQHSQFHAFLKQFVALSSRRESAELDDALSRLLTECISLLSASAPHHLEIVRLRALKQWSFQAAHRLDANLQPQLLQYAQLADAAPLALPQQGWTVMLLRQPQSHHQAVVLIQSMSLNDSTLAALGLCIDTYQHFASLIYENERDALTGLLNRKTFDRHVSKIVLHTENAGKVTKYHSIVIFDIDHFKQVNDQFGHMIGDEVLLLLSQLMRSCFRESDLLFRFGGEEFVGVFSCTNAGDVKIQLNRFVQHLAAYRFPQVGKVTVSIGYAQLEHALSPGLALERADLALYYAKQHGRDQICNYEALIAEGLLSHQVPLGDMEIF